VSSQQFLPTPTFEEYREQVKDFFILDRRHELPDILYHVCRQNISEKSAAGKRRHWHQSRGAPSM
jgi:hypothetical protein